MFDLLLSAHPLMSLYVGVAAMRGIRDQLLQCKVGWGEVGWVQGAPGWGAWWGGGHEGHQRPAAAVQGGGLRFKMLAAQQGWVLRLFRSHFPVYNRI